MKLQLTAHDFAITGELEKYVGAKLEHVVKLLPRNLRQQAAFRLHFTQTHSKAIKYNTCNVTLMLPGTELRAKETTQHMYAALDIAAVHIEHQLADYLKCQELSGLRHRVKRGLRADWPAPGTA